MQGFFPYTLLSETQILLVTVQKIIIFVTPEQAYVAENKSLYHCEVTNSLL